MRVDREDKSMHFIEIADADNNGVQVNIEAIAAIQPSGFGGATLVLIGGREYRIKEDANLARDVVTYTSNGRPGRLTRDEG
jgi:hypothetical protein